MAGPVAAHKAAQKNLKTILREYAELNITRNSDAISRNIIKPELNRRFRDLIRKWRASGPSAFAPTEFADLFALSREALERMKRKRYPTVFEKQAIQALKKPVSRTIKTALQKNRLILGLSPNEAKVIHTLIGKGQITRELGLSVLERAAATDIKVILKGLNPIGKYSPKTLLRMVRLGRGGALTRDQSDYLLRFLLKQLKQASREGRRAAMRGYEKTFLMTKLARKGANKRLITYVTAHPLAGRGAWGATRMLPKRVARPSTAARVARRMKGAGRWLKTRKGKVAVGVGIAVLIGTVFAWRAYARRQKRLVRRASKRLKRNLEKKLSGIFGTPISLSNRSYKFFASRKGNLALKIVGSFLGRRSRQSFSPSYIKRSVYGSKAGELVAINGETFNKFIGELEDSLEETAMQTAIRKGKGISDAQHMRRVIRSKLGRWKKKEYLLTRRNYALRYLCDNLYLPYTYLDFMLENFENFPIYKLVDYVNKDEFDIHYAEDVMKEIRRHIKRTRATLDARELRKLLKPYFRR